MSRSTLAPFLIVAFLFALLAYQNTDAVHSHFQSAIQSPVDPTATNTPVPPQPTNTPVPPQPTNTPIPAPTLTPPPPTSTTAPTQAEPVPVASTPTALPQPDEASLPTPAVLDTQPGTELIPIVPGEGPIVDSVPEEESGFYIINEVALIDTLLQWFAWFWLCFGVAIILMIPLVFVYLQIRGKN